MNVLCVVRCAYFLLGLGGLDGVRCASSKSSKVVRGGREGCWNAQYQLVLLKAEKNMDNFRGRFYSLMEYSKAEEVPIILASGSNMMGFTDSRLEFLQDRAVRAVLQLSKLIAIKPIQRARSLKLAAVKHGTTVGSYRLEFETHQDFQAIVDFLDHQQRSFAFDAAARSYIRVTNDQSQPSQLLSAFMAEENNKSPSHSLQSSVQFPVIRRNIYAPNSACPEGADDELFGSEVQEKPAMDKKSGPNNREEVQEKLSTAQENVKNVIWHTTKFNSAPESERLTQAGHASGNESDGENDDDGAGTCESFSPASPSLGSPNQNSVSHGISRHASRSNQNSGVANVGPSQSACLNHDLDVSRRQSISQPIATASENNSSLRPAAASSTSSKRRPNENKRRSGHQKNLQVGDEISIPSRIRPLKASRTPVNAQETHMGAQGNHCEQSRSKTASTKTTRTVNHSSVKKKSIQSSKRSVKKNPSKTVSKALQTPANPERQPANKLKAQPKCKVMPSTTEETVPSSPIKRKADKKTHETSNKSSKTPRLENNHEHASHSSTGSHPKNAQSTPICAHAGCQTEYHISRSEQAIELDLPDLLSKLVRW